MTLKQFRNAIKRRYGAESVAAGIVALADETGIPQGTLRVVVYGHMTLDAERAMRIADALWVELDSLMVILRSDARFLLNRQ